MDHRQVDLVIWRIGEFLEPYQCLSNLLLVCRKWNKCLKQRHLNQYHKFLNKRNLITKLITLGYTRFDVYKSIPFHKTLVDEQFAQVYQLKYKNPNFTYPVKIEGNPHLIICNQQITNKKTEKIEMNKSYYIIADSQNKNRKYNVKPILKNNDDDHGYCILDHIIYGQCILYGRHMLLRNYIKKFKTCSQKMKLLKYPWPYIILN